MGRKAKKYTSGKSRKEGKKKRLPWWLAVDIFLTVCFLIAFLSVFSLSIKSERSVMISTGTTDLDFDIAEGTIHLAYIKNGYNIMYRTKTYVSISNEVKISDNSNDKSELDVLVKNGIVVISWTEKISKVTQIVYNSKINGEWQIAEKITSGSYSSHNSHLFVSANDTYITWETNEGDNRNTIYCSLIPTLGIFTVSEGGYSATDLDVHIGINDMVYLAWKDNRGDYTKPYFRMIQNGFWSAEIYYDYKVEDDLEIFSIGENLFMLFNDANEKHMINVLYGRRDSLTFEYNLTLPSTTVISMFKTHGETDIGGILYKSYNVIYGMFYIDNGWTNLLRIIEGDNFEFKVHEDVCHLFYSSGKDWFYVGFDIIPEIVDYGDVPHDFQNVGDAIRSPWEYFINPLRWMNNYVSKSGVIVMPTWLPEWAEGKLIQGTIILYIIVMLVLNGAVFFGKIIKRYKKKAVDKLLE